MVNLEAMTTMTNILYYAAGATTAIAGILHLVLVPNILGFNLNTGIFFIVAGLTQLFWVVPMIKKWGRPWYFAGIGGTIILMVMFLLPECRIIQSQEEQVPLVQWLLLRKCSKLHSLD